MLRYYPAVVEKEPDSDFGVFFPDFPGCVSAGTTIYGTLDGAGQALALHIQGMLQDGDALPAARETDSDFADLVESGSSAGLPPGGYRLLTLIPVHIPRTKRVNVNLDEALLAEIDSQTDNRSAFLDQAARALLASRK